MRLVLHSLRYLDRFIYVCIQSIPFVAFTNIYIIQIVVKIGKCLDVVAKPIR